LRLDVFQRREIIGCEDLALDNGEVDLDLNNPTGVDRAMYGHDVGIGCLETFDMRSVLSNCA